jgi:hypothetical protein
MKSDVVAVLLDARGAALCDECVGQALGVDGTVISKIVARLSTLPDFLRDSSTCSRCRRVALVTQTVVIPHALPGQARLRSFGKAS